MPGELVLEYRAGGGLTYRVLRDRARHLLVQECQEQRRRSYRIRRAELEAIMQEPCRIVDVYHQARLRRKARRRANGGCTSGGAETKLVPAV